MAVMVAARTGLALVADGHMDHARLFVGAEVDDPAFSVAEGLAPADVVGITSISRRSA
jgi:hypothetical protein